MKNKKEYLELIKLAFNDVEETIRKKNPQFGVNEIIEKIIKTVFFYFCSFNGHETKVRENMFIILDGISHETEDMKVSLQGHTLVLVIANGYNRYFDFKIYREMEIRSLLFIIPKLNNEESRENIEAKVSNSIFSDHFSIWFLEDLAPILVEYSRYISAFSDYFATIAIKSVLEGFDVKLEHQKWEIFKKQSIKDLKNHATNKLVLCLGAGISMSVKLPSWKKLLKKLMIIVGRRHKNDLKISDEELDKHNINVNYLSKRMHFTEQDNPLIEADFIKGGLYPELRRFLYQILHNTSSQLTSPLIEKINELCFSTAGVRKIINYNYDSIIYNYLNHHNNKSIDIDLIYDVHPSRGGPGNNIKLNHVHGFLEDDKSKLILTDKDYFKLFENDNIWNNVCQLDSYEKDHCLLIGLSIKDQNLRRLMYKGFLLRQLGHYTGIKMPHYALLQKLPIDKFLHAAYKRNYKKTHAAQQYLFLYHFLKELSYCQLGINVIWYKSYEEVPGILQRLY